MDCEVTAADTYINTAAVSCLTPATVTCEMSQMTFANIVIVITNKEW